MNKPVQCALSPSLCEPIRVTNSIHAKAQWLYWSSQRWRVTGNYDFCYNESGILGAWVVLKSIHPEKIFSQHTMAKNHTSSLSKTEKTAGELCHVLFAKHFPRLLKVVRRRDHISLSITWQHSFLSARCVLVPNLEEWLASVLDIWHHINTWKHSVVTDS